MIIALGLFLPLFARSSNCGGNTAAISACRAAVDALRSIAIEHKYQPYRIAELNEAERERFHHVPGLHWIYGARILVTSEPFTETERENKKIVVACNQAYDNVPQSRFSKAPMTHAVAYSDGSVGLIPLSDYKSLDVSKFVDVTTISTAKLESTTGGITNSAK